MDLSEFLRSLGPERQRHTSAGQHSGTCRDRQTDEQALRSCPQGYGKVKLLPLGCFDQVFVRDGEEFFSVSLLQFVRDSSQETAHSYMHAHTHTR